jgi:hypothetical protein
MTSKFKATLTREEAELLFHDQQIADVLAAMGLRENMSMGDRVTFVGELIDKTVENLAQQANISAARIRAVAIDIFGTRNVLSRPLKHGDVDSDSEVMTYKAIARLVAIINTMSTGHAAALRVAIDHETRRLREELDLGKAKRDG